MENVYKICPVCKHHPIALPNEVCSVCYNKVKMASRLDEEMEEKERLASQGIEYHSYIEKEWNEIKINGLDAIKVFTEYILDEIEDDEKHLWHKRRICFMQNMVRELDMKYFAPATRQQIGDFAQAAINFWDGKITIQDAKAKLRSMEKIVRKDILESYGWEPKDFLLWMMETEEVFDWMWSQWFECIHACIPDKCNDELWIKMFHKHFHNEIKAWIDK